MHSSPPVSLLEACSRFVLYWVMLTDSSSKMSNTGINVFCDIIRVCQKQKGQIAQTFLLDVFNQIE